ncbi:hypothetical protein [Mesotoga prima]|uniref:hypothetical protein n=1 Tax=Mesotoga prima TaxID=1184387 RepID=UPI0002C93ACD|nr:hypothetical protein [Mesotoga prima]CCU84146.1 hypothetical protein PHOSAC3_120763 [Mesotoga infera]HQC15144.1 hypothetical protein [Mesotoga prima]
MNTIQVFLPLDTDRFLRRECPYCKREFKIEVPDELLRQEDDKFTAEYMVEAEEQTQIIETNEKEIHCPYCGQVAPANYWFTVEQLNYIQALAMNWCIENLNREVFEKMKKNLSSKNQGKAIRSSQQILKTANAWINRESNDMRLIQLPCCHIRLKIKENWKEKIYCIECGFPHENSRIVDYQEGQ